MRPCGWWLGNANGASGESTANPRKFRHCRLSPHRSQEPHQTPNSPCCKLRRTRPLQTHLVTKVMARLQIRQQASKVFLAHFSLLTGDNPVTFAGTTATISSHRVRRERKKRMRDEGRRVKAG